MADDVSMIFFRSGRGDLDTAALALADRAMSVERTADPFGDELTVRCGHGPILRIAFVKEDHVRDEAADISKSTPHEREMSQCECRYEILIDDLDLVLDEINTLIEVQATLQSATSGFLFNSWNGEVSGPDAVAC